MPNLRRGPAVAGGLLLGLLLLGSVLVPAATALDISGKAIRVLGSAPYNPDTVQTYSGELDGGPGSFEGQGVAVAVLDTGVDNGHPTFPAGAWDAGAEVLSVCPDGDCVRDQDPSDGGIWDPDDTHGHGTHAASIILGRGASSTSEEGESLVRGLAPRATLVEVKVASTPGGASPSDIAEAVRWVMAYNDGETPYGTPPRQVKVISISLTQPTPQDGEDAKDRDEAMQAILEAHNDGILVVAPAGNCGPGQAQDSEVGLSCSPSVDRGRNTITSPGAAPEALTVGAMDDNATALRNGDHLEGYASRGPNPGGDMFDEVWRKPDLVAPGAFVAAACHAATPGNQDGRTDQLCVRSGTTVATPHAAGTAAILFQALRVVNGGQEPGPGEVKDLLTSTAEDWGAPGWDVNTGYGYLDAYASLVQAVNRAPQAKFTLTPEDPEVGEEVRLDASLTEDPDAQDTVVRYIWDFGDGSPTLELTGEEVVAHHTYQEVGTHTIRLTAIDSRGSSDETTRNLQVQEPPPEPIGDPPLAAFTWVPDGPRVDETVVFDGSNSTDPEKAGIKRYEWDFSYVQGDFEAVERTSSPTTEWRFVEPGAHRVALRVLDAEGLAAISTQSVRVLPAPPGPPNVTITNPQEGDFIQPGPTLISWVLEDDPANRFTLFIDGAEEATVTARTIRVDLSEGEHALRVVATGPGGQGQDVVNITATDDLQAQSQAPSGAEGCTTHQHGDGSVEEHCTSDGQASDCKLVTNGDGTVERDCSGAPASGPPTSEEVASASTNDAPIPPLVPLLAGLAAALVARRRA